MLTSHWTTFNVLLKLNYQRKERKRESIKKVVNQKKSSIEEREREMDRQKDKKTKMNKCGRTK